MSRILNAASVAAVGMTAATMLLLAEPGFANDLGVDANRPAIALPSANPVAGEPATQPPADIEASVEKIIADANADTNDAEPVIQPLTAESLAALVAVTPRPATLDPELRCLAGAVYFESRGESLPGQLAVAHVVINRAQSGRFPASLCGVVYQRSQFSFIRGGKMPRIREGKQWDNAIAIAQIAQDGSWKNHAPGALFFHARHVSPGWRKTRIAQIDNHIFYR
ncbi:MAG: cell wall hydrolase [Sphingopyxis sp.]|uniref:cell wall hydrolase n=1 Tax=Sphingopyxis sp. TaxID=1908224 RepID=UPI002AB9E8F0|nr:cell wall hydrolase [Sphingopyxis sp.]MDZ3832038.1 cell wall hydrolase [Sphingopyxis sp.]